MNCQANETSGKLHGPLFSIGTLVYLLSIKISHSTCDMDSEMKPKFFEEIVNEFRTCGLETI